MNCPKCSAHIEEETAIYCVSCGAELHGNTGHSNKPSRITPSSDKNSGGKSSNTLIICIAVIVAVALICGTAIGITVINRSAPDSPTPTTTAQSTEIQKGEVGTVEESTYNDEAKTGTVTESTAKAPSTTAKSFEADTYEDEYLFPTHNTYLTFEILSGYSSDQIDLICNEMYARHGQIFKKQKNRDYFSRQSWYVGKYSSMEYVVTLFNSYEERNLQIIADYRDYMGW